MPSQFQSFVPKIDPKAGAPRVILLRAELARRGLEGFVVPRADEHQGENVPKNAERLFCLSGFTGSAGMAIVLKDRAALFVDGRYTLQGRQQTDTEIFEQCDLAAVDAWIETALPEGASLGFDPWLHTADSVAMLKKAVAAAGGKLVAVDSNPIDTIWDGRPPAPKAAVRLHAVTFAGEESAAKLQRLREALAKQRCAAVVVSDPHNLAWLFNIRGGDVSHTPLPLGYALVPREGKAQIFIDPAKLSPEITAALSPLAELHAPEALQEAVKAAAAGKSRIRIDMATGGYALALLVEQGGGIADVGYDPVSLMKAAKNPVEREGTRNAHRRDGAALSNFLAWFDREAPGGSVTEISAAEKLEECRRQTNMLVDLSFPSISGAGPHAAIPHYRVSSDSNRKVEPGIFLIDSGGQYNDGTTDVTRTIAVGEPSPEMRDRYTRVLKGHIAIATSLFPKGTSGAQIDAFARRALWQAGLDFGHGTGHGVGSFLSVHEGPQRISKAGHAPLEAGMIVSNEPGYYKEGAYGIRIENLVLVEERAVPGGDQSMLGFETLTLAPIDLALVEPSLLSPDEAAWLNAYHARVRETLLPLVASEAKDWLVQATRAI